MKVLLIQAHLGRTRKEAPIFPLGLIYLASALDAHHEVKILDLNLWERDRATEMLSNHIKAYMPDIAGLSIRNIDTTQRADQFYYFKTVRPTARLIKDTKSDTTVVFGGPGFSAFAYAIMERVPECDFGVYLEGEESTPELLDNLHAPETVRGIYFRRNGAIVFTGERTPPDFSRLPMPRRERNIIDIKLYDDPDGSNIGIQSKRGCAMTCAYCNYPFLTGGRVCLRPPEKVVDEIEYLISLGIWKFSFVDNVFNVPQSHAREICREIIRRKLDVQWNAWYEIKNTTRELVNLAQQAGCVHFGFSPDGAADRMLARLGKQITEKDIDKTIRIISRAHGARAGYNFFLLPGMSVRDLAKTLGFFIKIPLALRGRGRVFGLGWVRIMPHTRILRTALREGIIREDAHLLPHDEKDLNKLFYCKRSSLFFDYIIIYAFKCVEQYLKPLVKAVLGRNRERTQTGDAPRHSGDRTAYIPALHYSGRSMPYHIISLQPNKIEDRAVSNSFRYLERQDAVRMEYIEFSFLKQAVKIMLHKEHSPLMRVYRNLVGVAKLLMSRGRIVILGAEPFSELTFFLARLKRLHTCIYFTSWPWDEERFSHRLLGTYREKAWRRFLDGTVSVSVNELPCKALARYGAKPYHIPHAVHAYLFCPGNARALSGKLNVLFVGHLQQHKGVHLLIDIIKQGAWDSAEFWFVGRGPYAEELKAMQQQGYPVKYFGFLRDRKKVAGIFQEADVLVLPSIKTGKHDEKFGMVLQEAMASSLAIIASDCVGPRQVIDNGKTGLLIPQNDRAALRDALHRLIDDPDLRAALGTNGRHKAEKVYDVKVVATKWLDIIRSLNHRPRGREVRDAAAGEKQRTRCASFTAVPACAAVKKTKERNLAMYYTRARSLIVFLVLLGAVLACSQSIKTDHNESVNRSLGHKTPFDEILHRKRTVRSLIEQKVGEGQDISRAQALDKKAGIAMKQGRMEECARLLLDAITLLEGGVVLERTEPDPTGQRKPVPVEISVGSPSVEVIAAVPDVDSGIKWSSPEAAFQAFQLPAENGKVTVQVGTAPVIIREIIEPGPAAAAPAAAGKKELPFGIHGIDQFDDRLLDLGIGWIRYAAKCSMVWDIIEPERGVFDWTLSDAALNEARRNGMHMLINVISFNRWDQGRGRGRGCRKLPKDLAAYKAFLEKAVRRYPFVDAWQIENEPDRRISWADTPENFAELLCTAYPVIKGANPDALVVAGGASRPLALSEEFWSRFFTRLQGLSTAGNRCFDVFDCHWFLHLHPTMETFGQFTEYIRDIQRRLAAAGYQDTPIWMTEIASYSGKPFLRKTRTTMPEISEKQQAAELVKLLVHGMNLGVSRMFWVRLIEWHNYGNAGPDSYFDNVGLINSPLTDGQSHKKLAYFTYKHLIATLRGADLRTIATLHLGENVHIYRVLKGAQPVYIVWAD